MQGAAVGIVGMSIPIAVGAGIAAKAPAGTPNLTGGFNTLAGFVPIATTAVVGKSLIRHTQRLRRRRR